MNLTTLTINALKILVKNIYKKYTMSLGMKYIYSDGQNWVVRNAKYSLKTKAFRFSKFGSKEEALDEAIIFRDCEEAKLKEIEDGQIVLQSQFEDQQRKLKELQEADYKRLLEKEAKEKLEKQKKKKEEDDAAWVLSEQKLDAKLWKVQMKDNYDYWKEKYPEEAATPEGINMVMDGYIALQFMGQEHIPSVDAIHKGYLVRKMLKEQEQKGIKLKINDIFKKNQIICK